MLSNCLYKETLSETLQVAVKKPTGKGKRFGALTEDELAAAIPASAKLVFQVMRMEAYESEFVALSHSVISARSHVSRPQVIASLSALCKAGWIEKFGAPIKQVQPYRMLKMRRQEKPRESAIGIVPKSNRKVAACTRCSAVHAGMDKSTGMCRTCLETHQLPAKIKHAKAEIEPGATVEQVIVRMKYPKLATKVERMMAGSVK